MADSGLLWADAEGFDFHRQLDGMLHDAIAFELMDWHDNWFASANRAEFLVDLLATAPVAYPFDVFRDSVVRMIDSFSPSLRPLGTLRTYQSSLWCFPSLCPILPDCVHHCGLCQIFWYCRLQFLKSLWARGFF
ncbi:unnamed protein product [Calypogeia fissa]